MAEGMYPYLEGGLHVRQERNALHSSNLQGMGGLGRRSLNCDLTMCEFILWKCKFTALNLRFFSAVFQFYNPM